MEFSFCAVDIATIPHFRNLSSMNRDICPLPNYNPGPHFTNMLSNRSSLHLRDHYNAVQSSLTPKQLEDFTQSLRTTFGREGNITRGSVGVVALSLAVLFDTLAREVKGELVPESGPIPGLFVKDVRGYYPPHVHTISQYLRLMPYIANNPTRMKEEAERFFEQFLADKQSFLGENGTTLVQDTTAVNFILSYTFAIGVMRHFPHIDLMPEIPQFDNNFNLNCDPETEDFKRHLRSKEESQQYAKNEIRYMFLSLVCELENAYSTNSQIEHFDLKANAQGKWPV